MTSSAFFAFENLLNATSILHEQVPGKLSIAFCWDSSDDDVMIVQRFGACLEAYWDCDEGRAVRARYDILRKSRMSS